jgi:hypothetical protein
MSEKIKELSKQAYEAVIENTPSMLVTKEMFEQKFADLILSEVLAICEDFGNKGKDGHYCADEIARTFLR